MFVLGIDPGLASTGYGVIRVDGAAPALVAAGVIRTDGSAAVQDRLSELYRDVTSLLDEYRPQSVAMERLFVNRNLQTASSVARASGVILLAAAEQGAEVSEYTPSQVKIAVSGNGQAPKDQVAAMVGRILGISPPLEPADAADALAVALCHLQSSRHRLAVEEAL